MVAVATKSKVTLKDPVQVEVVKDVVSIAAELAGLQPDKVTAASV